MMSFILVIHAITCVLLVLTILMQAGRGGGLTESFSSAESVFGAQTSEFMVRATSILATVFFVTSLTLAFFSAHQDRSLMDTQKTRPVKQTSAGKNVSSDPLNTSAQAIATVNTEAASVEGQVAPILANTQQ